MQGWLDLDNFSLVSTVRLLHSSSSKWYFIFSFHWPQFSPHWLATISVLCFLCGHWLAGSCPAQVSRNKRSRYGQFHIILSLQSGDWEDHLGRWHRPWDNFPCGGRSPPARLTTRGRDKYNHSPRPAFARLNKQKRYYWDEPPASLLQIFRRIL